jgi:hypothetical protein
MYKGLVFYMCTGRDFMETTNIYFDKILLEKQKQEIETVMKVTREKLEAYETMIGDLKDEK